VRVIPILGSTTAPYQLIIWLDLSSPSFVTVIGSDRDNIRCATAQLTRPSDFVRQGLRSLSAQAVRGDLRFRAKRIRAVGPVSIIDEVRVSDEKAHCVAVKLLAGSIASVLSGS
jgi:hypothetical protein